MTSHFYCVKHQCDGVLYSQVTCIYCKKCKRYRSKNYEYFDYCMHNKYYYLDLKKKMRNGISEKEKKYYNERDIFYIKKTLCCHRINFYKDYNKLKSLIKNYSLKDNDRIVDYGVSLFDKDSYDVYGGYNSMIETINYVFPDFGIEVENKYKLKIYNIIEILDVFNELGIISIVCDYIF